MLDSLRILARTNKVSQLTQDQRNHFYWSSEWRRKQIEIKKRDNQECQVCKSEGEVKLTDLMVHHIKPLEYYPEARLDDDNLLTVCLKCHNAIHFTTEKRWDDEWWGD